MIDQNYNTDPNFKIFIGHQFKLFLPSETVAELDRLEEQAALAADAEKKRTRAEKNCAKSVEPRDDLFLSNEVEIISKKSLDVLDETLSAMDSETARVGQVIHSKLKGQGRYKPIPALLPGRLQHLYEEFENFKEVTQFLEKEFTLMQYMPSLDFRIQPILLLGDPAIGKTAFANSLAKTLQLPYAQINGAEPSFALTGSNSTWKRAAPGAVVRQIAENKSASPVFLVDEVDKGGDDQYPLSTALLQLLESENSKSFKDEFFQVQFDASHIIWILTANSVKGISAPLLSRLTVFEIQPPKASQRARIIDGQIASLNQKTRHSIRPDQNSCHELATRIDLDLRSLKRIVQYAYTAALTSKTEAAKFILPPKLTKTIGFY